MQRCYSSASRDGRRRRRTRTIRGSPALSGEQRATLLRCPTFALRCRSRCAKHAGDCQPQRNARRVPASVAGRLSARCTCWASVTHLGLSV